MPRELTQEQRDSIAKAAEVGANLFEIMHSIKEHGLDKGIEEFKKKKEIVESAQDEDDF